jgi:hypothetical protein
MYSTGPVWTTSELWSRVTVSKTELSKVPRLEKAIPATRGVFTRNETSGFGSPDTGLGGMTVPAEFVFARIAGLSVPLTDPLIPKVIGGGEL